MKEGDKKGQFYLIAAIIIAGLVIGISYVANYSKKISYDEGKDIATELRIESEKVLDYNLSHPGSPDEFEDFLMRYSYYVGADKDIYFIIVDIDEGVIDAYKFVENKKVDYRSSLDVGKNEIYFTIGGNVYTYPLEEGKNFYYLITYYKGDEEYVYQG